MFIRCEILYTVVLSDGLASIGRSAFNQCRSLTSLTIPDSVTSIDSHAFFTTPSLTRLNYTGTMEQWNAIDLHRLWLDSAYIKEVLCSNGTIQY
jgi:hypothetical protein